MELAHCILVLLCIFNTLKPVRCNGELTRLCHITANGLPLFMADVCLIDSDGPYRFVSEDDGAAVVRIASRATQGREAYIFFHTNNTYVFSLYG